MYNWSIDEIELKKYPNKHAIWKMEQLINFGLGSEKLSKTAVTENIDLLNIDANKRHFLKFLLK